MFCRHPVVKLGMKSLLANFPGWIHTAGPKAPVIAPFTFQSFWRNCSAETKRRFNGSAPKMPQKWTQSKTVSPKISSNWWCYSFFHLHFFYIIYFMWWAKIFPFLSNHRKHKAHLFPVEINAKTQTYVKERDWAHVELNWHQLP